MKDNWIKFCLLVFIIPYFAIFLNQVFAQNSLGEQKYDQKNYSFTTDWFTGKIPTWTKLLARFKGQPNVNYLEIGVFEGRSLLWMLENILTHPTSRAIGVDYLESTTYKNLEAVLFDNLKISGFQDKVKIIKGCSQVELKKLPVKSFDIIYIDGDHKAASVLTDTVFSWPLLKKRGILIFDDYKLHLDSRPPAQRPKIAIDAFIANYSDFIKVIYLDRFCMIQKKGYINWEQ